MSIVAFLLCILVTTVTAIYLYRKLNPQGVLMLAGLVMLTFALILNVQPIIPDKSTGSVVFDLVKVVEETFIGNLSRAGLMIMTIGGFVAYMKQIKASDALVYVSMQPLSIFRKYPYLAASLVIPIGQLLFICTPSATGLGLLLVASIYPVLVSLGVSKLSAVSVISACTVFDMGPASANTARASELVGMNNVMYFIEHQMPLTIPMTILLMIMYYFSNRYYDKKDALKKQTEEVKQEDFKVDVPLIYAILPVLPLILLIVFSKYIQLFSFSVELDTTTAMLMSFFVAIVFEFIRQRNIKQVFASIKTFWDGMGKVFATVITLIVAAEVFSRGLISLGFIDSLVMLSQHIGFSGAGIAILMTLLIFAASMLMGSGNASFFSFGPLVPSIAAKVGVEGVHMILPMQLASSMGRAASPIAGVIIAISEIAGVSSFDLARRNLIPLSFTMVVMLIYHFFIA